MRSEQKFPKIWILNFVFFQIVYIGESAALECGCQGPDGSGALKL